MKSNITKSSYVDGATNNSISCELLIAIHALQRSGLHGVVGWVLSHLDSKYLFINHAMKHDGYDNGFFTNITRIRERYSTESNIGKFEGQVIPTIIVGIEDEETKVALRWLQRQFGKKARRICNVLVIRDPYNLYASRLRGQLGHLGKVNPTATDYEVFVRKYQDHAKIIDNSPRSDDWVTISFNEWFTSGNYRKVVRDQLNLSESAGARHDAVLDYGGGSSFDGLRFDGKASEMKILDRWREFESDPKMIRILRNKQLARIDRQYFGTIYGKSE